RSTTWPLAARESCRHRALLLATCESKPVSGPGPSLAREANPCQKAGCAQNRLERSATSGAPALDGPEGARPRTGRATRQDSRTLRRRDAEKKEPRWRRGGLLVACLCGGVSYFFFKGH